MKTKYDVKIAYAVPPLIIWEDNFSYRYQAQEGDTYESIRTKMFENITPEQKESVRVLQFKLTATEEDPSLIDFSIMGLRKNLTIIKGELVQTDYYNMYDELVVTEYRKYNRNQIGIIESRDTQIDWYLSDGSVGHSKYWTKTYSPEAAIEEGVQRRTNIINKLKYDVVTLVGGQTNAFDFLLSVKTETDYYITSHKQPLIDKVNNLIKLYLTPTIKQKIINDLTF